LGKEGKSTGVAERERRQRSPQEVTDMCAWFSGKLIDAMSFDFPRVSGLTHWRRMAEGCGT